MLLFAGVMLALLWFLRKDVNHRESRAVELSERHACAAEDSARGLLKCGDALERIEKHDSIVRDSMIHLIEAGRETIGGDTDRAIRSLDAARQKLT